MTILWLIVWVVSIACVAALGVWAAAKLRKRRGLRVAETQSRGIAGSKRSIPTPQSVPVTEAKPQECDLPAGTSASSPTREATPDSTAQTPSGAEETGYLTREAPLPESPIEASAGSVSPNAVAVTTDERGRNAPVLAHDPPRVEDGLSDLESESNVQSDNDAVIADETEDELPQHIGSREEGEGDQARVEQPSTAVERCGDDDGAVSSNPASRTTQAPPEKSTDQDHAPDTKSSQSEEDAGHAADESCDTDRDDSSSAAVLKVDPASSHMGEDFRNSDDESPADKRKHPASPSIGEGEQMPTDVEDQGIRDDTATHASNATPAKYRPSLRTPKAAHAAKRKSTKPAESSKTQTVPMAVHVVFLRSRRDRCRVTLIPSRVGNEDDEIEVQGPNGTEIWVAYQDEWYSDLLPDKLDEILMEGAAWTTTDPNSRRWVLSGREIWVLAPSPQGTLSGFVSVPRLMLSETHLVLCRAAERDAVLQSLEEAGCDSTKEMQGNGVPEGWVLFQNVVPTIPIEHDEAIGLLNMLRPTHDLEIVLEGGIRLGHANWLEGHPPSIRIRGSREEADVLIDGQVASRSGNRYIASGWNTLGHHTVFCGGVSETYRLVTGQNSWEPFSAYIYQHNRDSSELHICGPLVFAPDEDRETILAPASNRCAVGPVPGQIAILPHPYDTRLNECVASIGFPVAWLLPPDAHHSDKSRVTIQAVGAYSADTNAPIVGGEEAALRWAQAILNAARKGLRLDANRPHVQCRWDEYKRVARQLWRRYR